MRFFGTGRKGRVLLIVSSLLLAIFLALLFFQWRRAHQDFFTPDADLLQELAEVELVPEETPPSGDWPQWRGPNRDAIASGEGLLSWAGKGPPMQWKQKIGEGYAAFVGAGDRIYTIVREEPKEVVLSLNLNTGEEIWRHAYDCPYRSSTGSGPRSSPALSNGKLYTVGVTGLFHCLDAATGKVIWQHDLARQFSSPNLEWGVCFSPLIDGDLIFTNPGGPKGGSVAAFNKDTGAPAWQALDDLPGYSSPILANMGGTKQVIFLTAQNLVGLEAATGKLLWKFPWQTAYNVNAATPILINATKGKDSLHYVFISSNYGKGCALVKVEGNAAIGFQARSVYQGTQMKNHFSTCVRQGEHLFGFDDTTLACMHIRSGEIAWKKNGYQKGSLLRVGKNLIVLGETGRLTLADAPAEEFRELADFKPLARRCWTMPVLIDGRLIVRDEEQVKCFDLRAN